MKEAGAGWVVFKILLLYKLSMARKTRGHSSKAEKDIEDTKENTISNSY